MLKNGFTPNVTRLEGREQPGSMLLSTALDGALLAGLGDAVQRLSRPIASVQAPADKTDAGDVAIARPAHVLNTQTAGTIKQAESQSLDDLDGLFAKPKTYSSLKETGQPFLPPGYVPPGGDGSDSRIPYKFWDGDADGVNGFTNEFGTLVSDANTWTDIRNRVGTSWESAQSLTFIDNVGGGTPLPTTANFQKRGPGVMTTGNSCLAATETTQVVPITATLVDAGPFFGAYELYSLKTTAMTPVAIAGPAHSYFSLQPIGSGVGQFYIATTAGGSTYGQGQVGQPLNPNGDTHLTSVFFGFPCANWDTLVGPGDWEVSHGVSGTI